MADLKAESERLESLAREKAHADKLKSRIADMNADIARRTAEYEELRAAYEQQVRSNQILNDTGSTVIAEGRSPLLHNRKESS